MTNQSVVVALACTLLSATLARAQDDPGSANSRAAVEITPYVFLASGASSGVGAAVRWPVASHFSLELDTNYRRAEVNALSSNLSMLFDFPEVGRVTSYIVGGIGLDQYGTAESLGGRVVRQARTAFSVNAGGGIRVQADENWGMRTDARWSKDLGRFGPERWRLYNGVTFVPSRR